MAKKTADIIHICTHCGKTATKATIQRDFYKSDSQYYKGTCFTPLCKECVRLLSLNGLKLNINKFTTVLRIIDKPFLPTVFYSSIDETVGYLQKNNIQVNKDEALEQYGEKIIGYYMKNIMLNNSGMTWDNGETKEKIEIETINSNQWGGNYTQEQVEYLDKLYKNMSSEYTIVTTQHKESLKLACKMQLKLDVLFEEGNMSEFAKLNDQYLKLLQSSGLRPIDKKNSADTLGLKSFSQIYEEVERDGFIKPKPITYQQDIVDRTIQYILNYNHKLFGREILAEPPEDTPKVDEENGDNDGIT